jgi:hypothetical protein
VIFHLPYGAALVRGVLLTTDKGIAYPEPGGSIGPSALVGSAPRTSLLLSLYGSMYLLWCSPFGRGFRRASWFVGAVFSHGVTLGAFTACALWFLLGMPEKVGPWFGR